MARSKKRTSSSSGARPASTLATTTTPVSSTVLSSFAPRAAYFALLTQALDRHRLRIYAPQAGAEARLAANYVLPNARATALVWAELPPAGGASEGSKKRRKDSSAPSSAAEKAGVSVVALGLSDGTVSLFSPTHARVVRVLSDTTAPSSGSRAVQALLFVPAAQTLYAACADATVRAWNLADKEGDDAPARTSTEQEARALLALTKDEVLVASHAIQRLEAEEGAQTWTGYASSVEHLTSVGESGSAFLSAAEGDRVLTLWSATSARPLASLPLEAPARRLASFALPSSARTLVLALTQSGVLGLYDVPAALIGGGATPAKRTPALEKKAQVQLLLGKKKESTPLLDAVVVGDQLHVAALVRGAKLVLENTSLLDESGSLPSTIELIRSGTGTAGLLHDGDVALTGGVSSTQRYADAPGSASRSTGLSSTSALASAKGLLAQPDDASGPDAQADLDADLDPDGAEPTLAARLKGLGVAASGGGGGGGKAKSRAVGLEAESDAESDSTGPIAAPLSGPGGLSNGISLAQTLTQALHSDDGALLSSCLAHSDPTLIRESVRRLSGPLAVRLLEAAVVRLGQGQKSKGALGSQRARGLTEWIRCTLAAHTGYLMSLPNLVSKLSTLHSVLSSRLASHEALLSLSGRLELVLAQIELRTAYTAEAAARAPVQGVKGRRGRAKAAKKGEKKWVEESSDDDNDADMDLDEEESEEEGDEVDVVRMEDESSEEEEDDIALGNESGAGATSAESASEDEDKEEDVVQEDAEMRDAVSADESEEDEDESDESQLEDDSDEVDDEEDDSEAEKGGLFDLEASEEDEDEEEDDDDE